MSHTDELEEYDAELELRLKREYADVFPLFRFCVLTQEATYLCNRFERDFMPQASYPFFHITMEDVWVWDKNRPDADHPEGRDLHDPGRDGGDPEGRRAGGAAERRSTVADAARDRRREHADPGRGLPAARSCSTSGASPPSARPRPTSSPPTTTRSCACAAAAWASSTSMVVALGRARRSRPSYRSLALKYLRPRGAGDRARACAPACRSPSTTRTSSAPTGSSTPWPRYRRHGGPCIVVDFGTATTFDAVSEAGEYLGGAIAPGIETSLDALTRPGRAPGEGGPAWRRRGSIGKSTVESMRSGIVYGTVAMVDGLVERMKEELGRGPFVVATGGLRRLVVPLSLQIDEHDPLAHPRGPAAGPRAERAPAGPDRGGAGEEAHARHPRRARRGRRPRDAAAPPADWPVARAVRDRRPAAGEPRWCRRPSPASPTGPSGASRAATAPASRCRR